MSNWPSNAVQSGYQGEGGSDPLLFWRSRSAHGGQDSYHDPQIIEDHVLALALDLETRIHGKRRRRPGARVIVAPSAAAEYSSPHGLTWFEDDVDRYLAAHYGTRIALYDGAAWTELDPDWLADRDTMIVQGAYGELAQAALFFAVVHGTRQPLSIAYHSGGGVFSHVAIPGISPRCLAWNQNCMWAGFGQTVAWSEVGRGDVWTGGSTGSIDVDLCCGDEIMAIVPIREEDPIFLVFMQRRIYALALLVTGSGLDFENSYTKIVTNEVGTVATRSVATLGDMVPFLAHDGVRAIQRATDDTAAGTREPISRPIEDWIKRINWAAASRSVAQVFGSQYHLAVPIDGAQAPSHVLSFDYTTKGWTVWTLQGGAMALGAVSSKPALWYLRSTPVEEETVEACHLYEVDPSWATEGTIAFNPQEMSPAIHLNMPDNDKEWKFVVVEYANGGSGTATVLIEARVDQSATWTTIGTITAASSLPVLPAYLPWNLGPEIRTRKAFSLGDMPIGTTIQFRLSESGSGVFINYGFRVFGHVRALRWD